MTQQHWTIEQFTRTLDVRLDGLLKGQILLQDLPPAVAAWFYAGEAFGWASRQPEIDRLEAETNRLGIYAFEKDDERKARYLARLHEGLATAAEERWQQLETDLRTAAGHVIETATAEIEVQDDGSSSTDGAHREAA